jgi:hypothetical protein
MTKAKRKPEAAPKNDVNAASALTTMMSRGPNAPELVVKMEVMSWDLGFDSMSPCTRQEIKRLSLSSHVFRDLMRQWSEHRKAGTEDEGLYSLTRLWALAGSPEDKHPGDLAKRLELVEDLGAEGVWADYESALWYVGDLDEKVGFVDILDLVC